MYIKNYNGNSGGITDITSDLFVLLPLGITVSIADNRGGAGCYEVSVTDEDAAKLLLAHDFEYKKG
jgi:hypothetical protein